MPTEEQKPRLSNFEVEEKSGEADAILNNPVFRSAVDEIHSRAVGTLVTADVGSLTAQQAHAMIKAINEIKTQLGQYIVDDHMRKKYAKGDK
jgi:hypothetical protein